MTGRNARRGTSVAGNGERYLRALFEQDRFGVAQIDVASGRFVRVNQRYCDIVGLSARQIEANTFMEITHPDDLQTELDEVRRLVAGEVRSTTRERCYRRPDGSRAWLRVTVSAMWAPGEEPDFTFALVEDITALRQAEEDLRRSEETFARAFRASPSPMAITSDVTGRFVDANESFERLTGWSREEIVGRTSAELDLWARPEERDRFIARVRDRGGEVRRAEVEMRTKSGAIRSIEMTAEVADIGGEPCRLSAVRDVTEELRARRALEESEARLRLALDAATDAIWDWDLLADTAYLSPRHYTMLGYEPGGLPAGREAWRALVHPEDLPGNDAQLADYLAGKLPAYRAELRMRSRSGEWRWVEVRGQVVERDVAGRALRMAGTESDVTERRRLEEQLRQSQKMEVVGQLAAGVAHDFNNLLAAIGGYAETLRDKLDDRPALRDLACEIAGATARGARLTRQLLVFGRRRGPEPALLDLAEVVGHLGEMLGRLLGEGIALELDCEAGLPPVRGDRGMIEQLIINLAVNARDAMARGGRLSISLATADLDPAQGARHPRARPGRFACLTITDTGTGIAPEHLPRLFEPFFTTKDVGKGTGLGLATAWGIAAQHDGWIEATSDVGQGASFAVFLPAAAGEPEAVAATSPRAPDAATRGHEAVLLVEDEPAVRRMLHQFLEDHGYRVTDAETGAAAQEVWRRHGGRFDALATDVAMPEGVSGFDLAAGLLREKPDLCVVFMSGYSLEAPPEGVTLVKGANYLQKPFPLAVLLEALRRQLDARG